MTQQFASVTRLHPGQAWIVLAMQNLHVQAMVRAILTRLAIVIILRRLRTNIGRVVLVKNVKNIGMDRNAIYTVTLMANIFRMNFHSALFLTHVTVLTLVVMDLVRVNYLKLRWENV
jgi:hypothetical protein